MNPSSENRRRLGMTKHKRSVLLSNASDIGLHPKAFARKSMKYPHAYFVQFSAIYFSGRTITTFQYTVDKKQEQNIAAILLHIKTIQSISIFCKL